MNVILYNALWYYFNNKLLIISLDVMLLIDNAIGMSNYEISLRLLAALKSIKFTG